MRVDPLVIAVGVVSAFFVGSCGATHDRPQAALEAADDGGVDAAGAEEPDAAIAIMPDESCLLVDELAGSVRESCVDVSLDGTPCQANDTTCAHYTEHASTGEPNVACVASCEGAGAQRVWSVDCFTHCNDDCDVPSQQVTVFEVDIGDCTQRPVVACDAGQVTLQAQLDTTVESLIRNAGIELTEIREDSLTVRFANGCPVAFHAGWHEGPLTTFAPTLRDALQSVRWSCAMELTCSNIPAPSSIAVP